MQLKENSTKAERRLWESLRNRRVNKLKFRRQHPISCYIVDFYCHEIKLIIEVDGKIHNRKDVKEYDKEREEILKQLGFRILRFSNEEVLNETIKVINIISDYAKKLH